jgi:hypothetical protein
MANLVEALGSASRVMADDIGEAIVKRGLVSGDVLLEPVPPEKLGEGGPGRGNPGFAEPLDSLRKAVGASEFGDLGLVGFGEGFKPGVGPWLGETGGDVEVFHAYFVVHFTPYAITNHVITDTNHVITEKKYEPL